MKRTAEIIIFTIILLGLIGNALYWAGQKTGFHGDELYSHHFICCTDHPSISADRKGEPYLNNWHEASYYKDYLTISKSERFDVGDVFKSLKKDVHPPIFFILLELTISILSPGRLTKWGGISLNLVVFILTLVVLYMLSKRILRSPLWGMVTTFVYGVSTGAVSSVMFIRMYMVLTAVTVLFLYMHCLLWSKISEGGYDGKLYGILAGTGLTMIFGLLTHYYFLVFAFFMCAFMTVWLFVKKKTGMVMRYAGVMIASLAASVLIWNDLVLDMFLTNKGKGAFQNALTIKEWTGKIRYYILTIHNSIFGIPFGWFLGICIALLLILVIISVRSIQDKKEKSVLPSDGDQVAGKQTDERHMMVYQMFFAVVLYALVIAIIAPYKTDRYIFNLLPAVVLMIAFALKGFIEKVFEGKIRIIASLIAGIVLLSVVILGYKTRGVNYLFREYKETVNTLKEYAGGPALLVTNNNKRYTSCTSSYFLRYFPKTFVIQAGDYSHLGEAVASLPEDTDNIACFVSDELDTESAVAAVCDATGFENKGVSAGFEGARVYILGVR